MPATEPSRAVAFTPHPGPQTLAYTSFARELLYGGARGGGKTTLACGKFLPYAAKFGQDAFGAIFRQSYPELEQVQQEGMKLFVRTKWAEWRSKENAFRFKTGALLKLRFLESYADCQKYQGHQFCSAVGTQVLMADGSYRSIETLVPGDMVRTLIGPQPVQVSRSSGSRECYEVRRPSGEAHIGTLDHAILRLAPCVSRGLTQSPRHELQWLDWYDRPESPLERWARGNPDNEETSVAGGCDETSCTNSADASQGIELHEPRFRHSRVVLYAPGPLSQTPQHSTLTHEPSGLEKSDSQRTRDDRLLGPSSRDQAETLSLPPTPRTDPLMDSRCDDGRGALTEKRTNEDSLVSCSVDPRQYGEPLPLDGGSDQGGSPLQGGAETPSPTLCGEGGEGTTPDGILLTVSGRIPHPYTGQDLGASELQIYSERCTSRRCQYKLDTWAISIKNAMHYVSYGGFISRNCYMGMDESGNFSDERIFEDMRACLRSAVVPDKFWQILYTANPGGPMHHYLRNRFGIDRWPKGNQMLMDPQGRTRMFIPAKVTDNPSLSGTSYEQELRSIKDEAKRKAWLDGDWDVVSGAFFANSWSQANIMDWKEVPPRPWPIYRSMDWGSAEPFCVLWWTITNDDIVWENKYWPRGAVVVLKEWYGAEQGSTNKGIRMLAKDVGKGIHDREIRWGFVHRCLPGPADTSIWDTDGGPCQADLLREGGSGVVEFVPAYKNRIAGWENMRSMMQGRNGKPHFYLSRSCEAGIRTIPIVKRSERDIEDIDTRQDDHFCDCARYILNQFIRPKDQPKKDHIYSTKTDRRKVTALDDAFGY